MLSRDDRRRLDAIEQQLRASDPDLAQRLAYRTRIRWSTIGSILTIVIGTLATLLGLIILAPLLVLLSLSLAVTGCVWLFRSRHAGRGSRDGG